MIRFWKKLSATLTLFVTSTTYCSLDKLAQSLQTLEKELAYQKTVIDMSHYSDPISDFNNFLEEKEIASLNRPPLQKGSKPVNVKTLTGKTFTIYYSPLDTLIDFKRRVKEATKIPIKLQRFVQVNKRIDTDEKLSAYQKDWYKINHIHLVLRLASYEFNKDKARKIYDQYKNDPELTKYQSLMDLLELLTLMHGNKITRHAAQTFLTYKSKIDLKNKTVPKVKDQQAQLILKVYYSISYHKISDEIVDFMTNLVGFGKKLPPEIKGRITELEQLRYIEKYFDQ